MNTIETRRYEMLVRVRQFGEVHPDRFPKTTPGGEAFATIAAAVTELSGHAVAQLSSAREAKSEKAVAREALVGKLHDVAHAARVIAEETPGFDDSFHPPPKRQTDQRLLIAGRLFVRDAEAGKGRFIAFGLRETFLADLTGVVERFAQAILDVEAARDRRAAARAGIKTALASGYGAVRRLDVIVPIEFADHAETMAVWARDRRVQKPLGRKSVVVTPPAALEAGVSVASAPIDPAPHALVASVTSTKPASDSTPVPISTSTVESEQPAEADVLAGVAS